MQSARCLGRRWMSVRPHDGARTSPRKKVTIDALHKLHREGKPITMLTAYDYPSALACSAHDIDITLVGDSLAQVCLGYPSTTQLTLPEMIHHARAAARGTTHPLLVADMPFGSYHTGADAAAAAAVRLIQEARVDAVKLEGGAPLAPVVAHLVAAGIPVMGHVGLLPQRAAATSGFRVQGRAAAAAAAILRDAEAIQEAGAFAVVVEAVPHPLARLITQRLRVPTIGIGAGPDTAGQVLVWDDVMGTWNGHKATFVRRFADLATARDAGVRAYASAVRDRTFPNTESESYGMDADEWARLLEMVGEEDT